jgi:tetratricopeptide (TPR) repeat protein
LALPLAAAAAPAKPSPKAAFEAALAAFKKEPSPANREAVVKAARPLRPKPALPEGVERHEGRAEYAFKDAKSEADFALAAQEYQKACDAAPWHAPYYYNLAVAQEKAGLLAQAKSAFELYLLADPSAADAKEVRKRVAGLEYAIERASSPEARQAALLEKAEGARFVARMPSTNGASWDDIHEIKGGKLVVSFMLHSLGNLPEVNGISTPGLHHLVTVPFTDGAFRFKTNAFTKAARIREDGKALIVESRHPAFPEPHTAVIPRE